MRKMATFLTDSSLIGLVLLGVGLSTSVVAGNLEEAFDNGQVNGNIRIHYNERHYSNRPDASAFALGGLLKAETAPVGIGKLGVGFYTAQDIGMNNSDPARVDGRMGSEVEVLGEAYINLSAWDSSLTVGRQKIVTPFANPIDVFIIPFTFEGVSIKNNSISNLALELNLINTIKSAGSDEFVDVGVWSTGRLGVPITETSGTLMLGGVYKEDALAVHAWLYEFADLFTSQYFQVDYAFASSGSVRPFVSGQFIGQSETGDELLGPVDTTVYGFKAGVSINKAEVSLGYTNIDENPDAFRNGAFLAPYNFSTSPLYSNSMLQNMENNDAGEGVKLTFLYAFPSVDLKVSYADLDFVSIPDLGATDFDVTYNMGPWVEGLSLRFRVEIVSSDSDAVKQSDNRLQLQYLF